MLKRALYVMVALIFVATPVAFTFAEEDPSSEDVFLDEEDVVPPMPDTAEAGAASSPVADETGETYVEPSSTESDEAVQAQASEPELDPGSEPTEKASLEAPKKRKQANKSQKKPAPATTGHKAKSGRKVASKGGFRMLSNDCDMHESASAESGVLIKVKGSRKLWVEDQGEGWVKGFRPNGHGFMRSDCFE